MAEMAILQEEVRGPVSTPTFPLVGSFSALPPAAPNLPSSL